MEYRDRTYLQNIIEHCDRIDYAVSRFGDSYEIFRKDADYRDVICMNIFQIGELANQISDELREEHADIPWSQMYGIRNILAHAYIKIDDSIIWDTVKKDIPLLRNKLMSLI